MCQMCSLFRSDPLRATRPPVSRGSLRLPTAHSTGTTRTRHVMLPTHARKTTRSTGDTVTRPPRSSRSTHPALPARLARYTLPAFRSARLSTLPHSPAHTPASEDHPSGTSGQPMPHACVHAALPSRRRPPAPCVSHPLRVVVQRLPSAPRPPWRVAPSVARWSPLPSRPLRIARLTPKGSQHRGHWAGRL